MDVGMEDEEWVMVGRPRIPLEPMEGGADQSGQDDGPLKVVFAEPAEHWTDSAPIGNGCLGAMIWGGVASEKIQLNEDTLWTGVPGDYTNPNAPNVLSRVRKLVDDVKYAEVTVAAVDLQGNPPDVYQPLSNINLEFGDPDSTYDGGTYERELDLDTATVKVAYSIDGVKFTRKHFSSAVLQDKGGKLLSGKATSGQNFSTYVTWIFKHVANPNIWDFRGERRKTR